MHRMHTEDIQSGQEKPETGILHIYSLVRIAVFTALTAIGGMIRLPAPIVPMTLQTVFVYLSGGLLGWKNGAISQVLFLLIGLSGAPVFTMGGGPAYVLQPTFGYLLGFPVAAVIVGVIIDTSKELRKWMPWIVSHVLGMGALFFMGVVYLYINCNAILNRAMTWPQALGSGFVILLPGEIFKIVLSMVIARKLRPLLH